MRTAADRVHLLKPGSSRNLQLTLGHSITKESGETEANRRVEINVGCWKSCYVLMMIDGDIALDVVLDIDHIDGEGQ